MIELCNMEKCLANISVCKTSEIIELLMTSNTWKHYITFQQSLEIQEYFLNGVFVVIETTIIVYFHALKLDT